MPKSLDPIPIRSLHQGVAQALRAAIFSGELEPGSPLREMQLAGEFKVSQATIREALLRLEHAGLVVRTPNRGSIVTRLSGSELRERILIRIQLEGLACAEAAQRANPQSLEELRRSLDKYSSAVSRNDYFEASQADIEFHRLIWNLSANHTLYRILDQLTAPLFAFLGIMRSRQSVNLADVNLGHEEILIALQRGDGGGAREAIRRHIEASYEKFLTPAEAGPDLGPSAEPETTGREPAQQGT